MAFMNIHCPYRFLMFTQRRRGNKVLDFGRVTNFYGVYSQSDLLATENLLNRRNVLGVEEYK